MSSSIVPMDAHKMPNSHEALPFMVSNMVASNVDPNRLLAMFTSDFEHLPSWI